MRVGGFDLIEPLPELRNPHLLLVLRPWIDVGSVGTLVLEMLEDQFGAKDLGGLHRPGTFYDFTRYRPILSRPDGRREITLPSTTLRYAETGNQNDLVFAHSLEPHMAGEEYVESILQVMEALRIERYCMVGAMYGAGPHTRPLAVSGGSNEETVQRRLVELGVRGSTYEGPTSIMGTVTEEAESRGLEFLTLITQLPPYTQLDEDQTGLHTLLAVIDELYGFRLSLEDIREEGKTQYGELDKAVGGDPRNRAMIRRLEETYDAQAGPQTNPGQPTELPMDVERFLKQLEGEEGN